jgi:hypothetical protein
VREDGQNLPADTDVAVTNRSTPASTRGPLVVGPTPRGKQLGKLQFDAQGPVFSWESADRVARAHADLTRAEDRLSKAEADPKSTEAQRSFYRARVEELRAAVAAGPAAGAGRVSESALELSRAVADDPEAAGFVQGALAAMNQRPALPVDVPWSSPSGPYIGAAACQACHPAEFAQWAATPHAGAYLALVQDGHGRDPTCVGCHVTGYQQVGGPTDVATIAGFRDVQCEVCHGASRQHAEQPSLVRPVRDPPREVCIRCHDGDRDGGRFEPSSYRLRVVHGPVNVSPP